MNENPPSELTTLGTRQSLKDALTRSDTSLRNAALRAVMTNRSTVAGAAVRAVERQGLIGGNKLAPFAGAMSKNRAALSSILAAQRAAQSQPVSPLAFPINAQAERERQAIDLSREILEQQKLMVQVLQGLHAEQVAAKEAADDRDAARTTAGRRDFRVNAATLVITAVSLIVAVVAILLAT